MFLNLEIVVRVSATGVVRAFVWTVYDREMYGWIGCCGMDDGVVVGVASS